MPLINAYHGVNAATHQANVTTLSGEGYHPVTLCVYGDPGSPLYAAVWAKEPWPQWIAVHGQTAAQYQAWVTGTDAAVFAPLRGSAQFLSIRDGVASRDGETLVATDVTCL